MNCLLPSTPERAQAGRGVAAGLACVVRRVTLGGLLALAGLGLATAQPAGDGLPAPTASSAVVPALAASDSAEPALPPLVAVEVVVAGPTLVAVLPPGVDAPDAEGGAEAMAHVRRALARARQCVGGKPLRVLSVQAEQVTLKFGKRSVVLDLPADLGQVSAVLVEPGRAPRVVRAEVGPSALSYLLGDALADYWRLPRCRPR